MACPPLTSPACHARRRAFYGSFVHSISTTQIDYLDHALLIVDKYGVIELFETDVAKDDLTDVLTSLHFPEHASVTIVEDGDFIIPGLIDTHTHAVQYPNMGLGQQYERQFENALSPRWKGVMAYVSARCFVSVMDWLEKVTFPREKRFSDSSYARQTFKDVVSRIISLGTTTCCYYSSLHLEASKILADICHEKGQRAFVGKCNMDRKAMVGYCEKSASQSLEDTKEFIRYVRSACCAPLIPDERDENSSGSSSNSSNDGRQRTQHTRHRGASIRKSATPAALTSLVMPIVTPRFAISCTDALLTGLSALVTQDQSLHIQTHLAENPSEVAQTKELFPFADSYAHVYDHFNLLTRRTILAHCVHLETKEIVLIADRGSGIAHCPTSNFNLRSGASPIGELLDHGIKVGLGTDVSGGFGAGILSALREASVSAKVVAMSERDRESRGRSRGRSLTPTVNTRGSTNEEHSSETPLLNLNVTKGRALIKSNTKTFADKQLSIATLFHLATLGGAQVCALEERVGNFQVGKEFDALLIHTGQRQLRSRDEDDHDDEVGGKMGYPNNPSMFVGVDDTLSDLFEKFLFTGDDRNIGTVFVRGKIIGGSRPIQTK